MLCVIFGTSLVHANRPIQMICFFFLFFQSVDRIIRQDRADMVAARRRRRRRVLVRDARTYRRDCRGGRFRATTDGGHVVHGPDDPAV